MIFIRISGAPILRKTKLHDAIERIIWEHATVGNESLITVALRYIAAFVFLVFLRKAFVEAGFNDLESFLGAVVDYIPHLFVALLIAFLGIRMSVTISALVRNAVKFENQRTAKVLGNMARWVVLFFTFTIVLEKLNTEDFQIVSDFMLNAVIMWFVWAVALASWLAFWLGWKQFASEVIEEFRKKEEDE